MKRIGTELRSVAKLVWFVFVLLSQFTEHRLMTDAHNAMYTPKHVDCRYFYLYLV